ncbi:hypothetical protein [Novosphingobium sp. HII-3]|uniref:hypothetical protein n=1 Tax=Novosphingobium sp. HII-3 TaxID=2075565 RepID=UPI001304C751
MASQFRSLCGVSLDTAASQGATLDHVGALPSISAINWSSGLDTAWIVRVDTLV